MYAIIEVSGRQWRVVPGTRLDVNRLAAKIGAPYAVDRVLAATDGQRLQLGRPYLQGAKVVCEVLEHRLGPKVISYHFRRRENWRKTVGHRQPLTRLLVKEIVCNGSVSPAAQAPAPAVKKRVSKTSTKKAPAAKKGVSHGA